MTAFETDLPTKDTSRLTRDDVRDLLPTGWMRVEEAAAKGTRALVIGPYHTARKNGVARPNTARLAEAAGLAAAIDLDVIEALDVRLDTPRPATLLGTGKVEELAAKIAEVEIDLVMMDCALSPVQQRNLEKAFKAKVIDRTGLILEIFGRRARTREGRLQVELAHLTYQKSRLVRSWTHLERQRGGFGFLGGPGETQIETDRRLIDERIVKIKVDLEKVKRTRALHRKTRHSVPYPVVALVGYTNAGKSTLFNKMTGAEVFAQDMLFATLDPTMRAITLPHGSKVILSDTVGFISDLPTELISAFRATLEEAMGADIILHVRDIAHEDSAAQSVDVQEILTTLEIDIHDGHRLIEVWNKSDLLEADKAAHLQASTQSLEPMARPALVSAQTGAGLADLLDGLEARLTRTHKTVTLTLPEFDGAGLNWLYDHAEVLARQEEPAREDGTTGMTLTIRASDKIMAQLCQRFGVDADSANVQILS